MPPTMPHPDGDTSPCQDYIDRVVAPKFDPFATTASGADDQESDHNGTTNIDHSSAHTTTSWSLPGISPDRTFSGPGTSNPLVLPFGTIHNYDECTSTSSYTSNCPMSACIDPSAYAETKNDYPMDEVAHEDSTPAFQSESLSPGNIDDHEEGAVSCTPDLAASACIGQSAVPETTDNHPMDDVAHQNPTNGLQSVSPSQGGHHETSHEPAYEPRLHVRNN
ncbi:hypothetical protein BO79DRAFT_226530 [Aspergillus costaricaensis CBS 115574]|uniref:Uncharacterized protein n=1 Tax=Aspergillus costaricaensis CBS 115574 TaxID=1448317 RepID=A0ACD1IJU9_9EURO|nr:hypothetical protein BO79DRAFT_226530 [Aspergillus costaricaensis CBS 115574]RAK90744.1 hypothetical protein BO79DRAFT_226530 [Aspergillus costaricaensis CBS 115574]